MILSDLAILKAIEKGDIVIKPFDAKCLGSNSYDVHLGSHLAIYKDGCLDAAKHNETTIIEIPKDGFILQPNTLYLGVTLEYTETHKHVPFLEGKSSTGRLGISIHATAGKGDVGFCNHWTLEIFVAQRVRVYAGMPIGQLIYHSLDGDIMLKYNQKNDAKYTEYSSMPKESMMYKNAFFNGKRKGKNRALRTALDLNKHCTSKYAHSITVMLYLKESKRRFKNISAYKGVGSRYYAAKSNTKDYIFSPFKKYR